MRVLVTGATGFTGGRLVEMCRERGRTVVALARPSADTARIESAGAEIHRGDVTDAESVLAAARGCEEIYHIAALYRSAKHADSVYHDVNVGGTAHVLEAARRLGVRRVVHCSTVGVHGKVASLPVDENAPFAPGDIYQRTKLEGERLAQRAIRDGLPVVIARPAGIYGPGDLRFLKLFRAIQSRSFRMIGSGRVVYHFTYIDDLCRGFMDCAKHPNAVGGTFILCGDGYHPISEVASIVAEAVGQPLRPGRVPVAPVMLAATLCEALCKPLGIEPPLFRRRLDFFVKNRAFTNAHARATIGFRPRVGLRDGLFRTAAWYYQQGLLAGPAPEALAAECPSEPGVL
ncbi:MAG: NAD-dependent epimerase/dehydratase family protein [Phycisphaerales bacterium]